VTVTAGLIFLVYGIVRSAELGWGSGQVLGFIALAAVLLVAFVVIEYRSSEPLVRLSIFTVRTVRAANVSMLVVACGLFAMFFFNTLYVQRVLGYSALQAGLAFLPFTAGIIIGAAASQKLIARLGAREVPIIGLVIAVVGMLFFLRLDTTSSYLPDMLPGIMMASIGMGLTFVPVTLIATSGIPVDDAGLASGLYNTSQQIGGALGLAALSTLATSKSSSAGGSATHQLVVGFHWAFAGGAAVMVVALAAMVALLRRHHVARIEEAATREAVAVAS
jgi:predicted MFS family arabinose efflux permease